MLRIIIILSVVMLGIIIFSVIVLCCYAECHSAKGCYAVEFHYTEGCVAGFHFLNVILL